MKDIDPEQKQKFNLLTALLKKKLKSKGLSLEQISVSK
jgi:hypothetical protein